MFSSQKPAYLAVFCPLLYKIWDIKNASDRTSDAFDDEFWIFAANCLDLCHFSEIFVLSSGTSASTNPKASQEVSW